MSINFKAVVPACNRRRDGTYPVKIRVYFNRNVRRLATNLVCRKEDMTRSLKIKNPEIAEKAEDLIRRMRAAVDDLTMFDLEGKDVDWVVKRIRSHIRKEDFRLDFFTYADTFMARRKKGTAKAYASAVNAFERYLGKREIDINDISRKMVLDFQEAYIKSGKSKYAASRYVTALGTIHNAAKYDHNDDDSKYLCIPRSPFSSIKRIRPIPQGQPNLGVEIMQKIISAEADGRIRTALDVFIVSFGLMGANLVDLYEAESFEGDVWVYNRRKTRDGRADKALMKVAVPDEIKPFIGRLKGEGEWWLNNVHSYAKNERTISEKVNRHLRMWCEANGIEAFTFYAARHTWASLARDAGVDKSTIDDCLAHVGSYALADTYAERSWKLMENTNKIVLDLFDWGG